MAMEKILPFLSHIPEDAFTPDDLMANIAQVHPNSLHHNSSQAIITFCVVLTTDVLGDVIDKNIQKPIRICETAICH